ncbi:hypothetical protein F4678DRAFT_480116 [Xylaria arbuscula]|nr:hypothetical protein F4678DRAFT_480116 [Xylaria arbuscula]
MAPRPCKYTDKVDDTPISCRLASSFHTAPLEASPDAKAEYHQFSQILEPPQGFGPLSMVHDKPRGPTIRDGVHNLVFARKKVANKPNHHQKLGDGGLEINAALIHPEFNAYYNFEGRKIDELTETEKNVLEMSVHYPNIPNGIMKGPLYFRVESFTKPRAKQPDLFRQVFGIPELSNKIMGSLVSRNEDIMNLTRACQFTADKVQSFWMHLDTASNNFLGWDKDALADVRGKEAQKEREEKTKKVERRFFSPSIIISPVRPQDQGPLRKIIINKAGYPVTPGVKEYEGTTFENSMVAHYRLLHLSYLNGHAIKHLILHNLPWLNIQALQRILPGMIKLAALGVHQCFLLTLGDTNPLLHAINAINEKRAELNQPHVAADFTPFYFKGPPYKPDGSGHIGEYGIVPEDKEWLHSTVAVTAQLLSIRALCHKGNQDFFTPGTGFRSFLNRLPIRTMDSILKCIENIHNYETKKYHSGVGIPRRHITGTYLPPDQKKPLISEKLKHAMEITLWQDLIVSCNGRPMLKKELEDLIVLRGEVTLTHCVECKTNMPAYFFMAHVLARHSQDVLCHGCQLAIYLTRHKWHLHEDRRNLARKIFITKKLKDRSLKKVLGNIAKPARPWDSTKPIIPARDEIICRPGMVDSDFQEAAGKLWEKFTVKIPTRLQIVRAAIEVIDQEYHDLSYEDRVPKWEKRKELEREELQLEYELGTNQRNHYAGSLQRPCRSWELDMQDFRAELALAKGEFVNKAPMPIFNLETNVSAMMGRSGGLPEYWKDYAESDDNDIVAESTRSSLDTSVFSPSAPVKVQTEESGWSSAKNNDWEEESPVEPAATDSSSATTVSISPPTTPRQKHASMTVSQSTPSHQASNQSTPRREPPCTPPSYASVASSRTRSSQQGSNPSTPRRIQAPAPAPHDRPAQRTPQAQTPTWLPLLPLTPHPAQQITTPRAPKPNRILRIVRETPDDITSPSQNSTPLRRRPLPPRTPLPAQQITTPRAPNPNRILRIVSETPSELTSPSQSNTPLRPRRSPANSRAQRLS